MPLVSVLHILTCTMWQLANGKVERYSTVYDHKFRSNKAVFLHFKYFHGS